MNTLLPAVALSAAVCLVLCFTTRRRWKTREKELLSEAATGREEFVGFIAHELRNAVAVISGNARLLSEPISEEEHELAVGEIHRQSARMSTTISTLLALARPEEQVTMDTEPVLLHRLVPRLVAESRALFPELEVDVLVEPECPPVMAAPDALQNVLTNLLSNAHKYGSRTAPVSVVVRRAAPFVELSVTNPGPVLAADEFEHIFQPFFRLSMHAQIHEGHGLGLAICRKLVTAQGGELHGEALPAGGARFCVRLQIADCPV